MKHVLWTVVAALAMAAFAGASIAGAHPYSTGFHAMRFSSYMYVMPFMFVSPAFAPLAPMPMTSSAPRLADMKASPAAQAGIECPEVRKSALVFIRRRSIHPIPTTRTA